MYVLVMLTYVCYTYCENRSLIQSLMLMCPAINIVRFELQSGVVCLGAKGTLAPLPPSAMTRLTELVLEGCLGKHSPYVAMPCIGSDPQCPLYLQLQNETLVALVQVVYGYVLVPFLRHHPPFHSDGLLQWSKLPPECTQRWLSAILSPEL